jgi:PAS domain S-box-containing protein
MDEHFEKYRTELRRRADARVGSFSAALAKAPQGIQSLVHQLNLQQIELEMQDKVLQRAQEQVEESRDCYADLYESAPVGYFTLLKDGTIVEVNHAGAALVGMQPSDLRERRFQVMVTMKDREAFTKFCHGVLDTQEPGSCEVRLVHPKSEWGDDQVAPYLTVLIQAGPVRAGLGKRRYLRVAALDITERKHAEQLMKKARERLDLILTSISDQFFGLNGDWQFTYFNQHAAAQMKLLGKDPERLIGKVLWEEFPDVPNEESLRRVMSERVVISDELYYPPLGEWVENHMYPSPDGGLVTFQRYITVRKRAEEALRQAQTELALGARRSVVGEIAASISHEINQPLAAIVTNSETCLRWLVGAKPALDQLRQTMEDIIHDAKRASEVIARIRSLVKKTPPESIRLDLNELIQGVVALVHQDMLEHSVSLRFDLSSALPSVLADRIQMQQVLLNLILNGLEAMSEVEGHARELLIRTSRHDLKKEIVVVVRDTGAGLDPDKLEQIFAPFVTTKPGGMGMGLTISRSIIETHGGRLWAMPNDDWGATFTFTLPMA